MKKLPFQGKTAVNLLPPNHMKPPLRILGMSHIFRWALRVWEVKGLMGTKIRISKHESRNKFKISNDQNSKRRCRKRPVSVIGKFGFKDCFGFRISDFEFNQRLN